jgi:predicted nucleotidyltransferase
MGVVLFPSNIKGEINKEILTQLAIALPMSSLEEFCQHWRMQELAVFGSVLRSDFSSSRDVDFLYLLMLQALGSLGDLIKAEAELANITGRRVDLVSKKSIQKSHTWLRRKNILSTARIIYLQKQGFRITN